jgi:hypothetical protein
VLSLRCQPPHLRGTFGDIAALTAFRAALQARGNRFGLRATTTGRRRRRRSSSPPPPAAGSIPRSELYVLSSPSSSCAGPAPRDEPRKSLRRSRAVISSTERMASSFRRSAR